MQVAMSRALTLAELDAEVAEIRRDTTRRLQLVPFEGRYGDWDALARKHREMLAILDAARERLGELQPPSDRTDAYHHYLRAHDRQLVLERSVLAATEARDLDTYVDACRVLARAIPDVVAAGARAGLRSARPPLTQRVRIWVTLPWHIVKANRHARAEHRAGRRW
jgi:hypothetical protein